MVPNYKKTYTIRADPRITSNDKRKFFLRRLSIFPRRSSNSGDSISSRSSWSFKSFGSKSYDRNDRRNSVPFSEINTYTGNAAKDRSTKVKFDETPQNDASRNASQAGSRKKFRGFTGIRTHCNLPLDGNEDSAWSALRKELQNLSMRQAREEAETREGKEGETALHLVCRQNPPSDIVDKLLWASSDVAAWPTQRSQWLPLHILCYRGASEAAMRRVIQAYPDARLAVDLNGQTPLHLYIRYEAEELTFSKIHLLMVPQIVNMCDKWEKLPITMKQICNMSEKLQPEQIDEKHDALKCASVFLDGKLDCLRRPSSRSASELITLLEGSPEWFKCHVMVHPYVKAMLNWRITRNFPTAVLMLDFDVLALLIVFFRMVSFASMDARLSESHGVDEAIGGWGIVMLYLGVAYLLLRELLQMASLAFTGEFSSWVFDVWNWLDVLCIGTVLKTTVHMHFGTADDEHLRFLVVITTAVLWMMLLSFLKLTRHNFAVFVTGVIHVAWTVSSFIFMLSLILLAFAQMFATKYQGSERCMKYMDAIDGNQVPINLSGVIENDFCTKYGSYLKVYTMLIGGQVDDADFVNDRGSLWLSVAFSFLVVLLLNLLIAVITDSYSEVKSHGDTVFWSHRLSFVYEVDHISDMFGKNEKEEEIGAKTLRTLSLLWDIAMATFEDPSNFTVWKRKSDLEERWNGPKWLLGEVRNPAEMKNLTTQSFDNFTDFARKIFYVIFVPVWFFFGFLSAGFLWPPQVRRWLICPDVVESNEMNNALSSDELGKAQKEIKNEIKKVEATMDSTMESLGTRMLAIDREVSQIKGDINTMKDSIQRMSQEFFDMKDSMNIIKNLLSRFLLERRR